MGRVVWLGACRTLSLCSWIESSEWVSRVSECSGEAGIITGKPFYCRKYGFLGLYKGLEAKLLQTVLTAALMFVVYEKITATTFKIMGMSRKQNQWEHTCFNAALLMFSVPGREGISVFRATVIPITTPLQERDVPLSSLTFNHVHLYSLT